ncbi:levanase [Asaia sp. W19]|uniref:glycoside hydrolase family 32 protein n=1 Tax=unclassified Asaia TaxID=2685023 RepID=UPI000F8E7BAA|nr:glycoside hydrolase family 32 protein [Asaia sp. W19]RUT26400.1 levanase [Asaia sp. W19]
MLKVTMQPRVNGFLLLLDTIRASAKTRRFRRRVPPLLLACAPFFSSLGSGSFSGAHAAPAAAQTETAQWRPALRYSPAAHWMNDPNGPILLNGLWHLYYQYNPAGMVWGHTSWGHATSRDLLHWQEQKVALPASPGRDIFSGSVVLDERNRSGLGTPGKPALLALYTTVFNRDPNHPDGTQAQSLAISRDQGGHFEPHDRNPVLTLNPDSKQFRDPSVIWYAPGQYWVMTTVVADAQVVKLYRSKDLIHWDFLSDFQPNGYRKPGMLWEMPVLIPLPLDGRTRDMRWIMIVSVNPWSIAGGSGVQYFIGHFDGTHFTADDLPPRGADPSAYHWLDHGADNYAAIRLANTKDGARCLVSWMNNWAYADRLPSFPWRGQMSLPVCLSLETRAGQPVLLQAPVPDYARLVQSHAPRAFPSRVIAPGETMQIGMKQRVQDISLMLRSEKEGVAELILRRSDDGHEGTTLRYDFGNQLLTLDRSHSGRTDFSPDFSPVHIAHIAPQRGVLTLHVAIDRSSVEVFANGGEVRMTDLVFPDSHSTGLSLSADRAAITIDRLRVAELAP